MNVSYSNMLLQSYSSTYESEIVFYLYLDKYSPHRNIFHMKFVGFNEIYILFCVQMFCLLRRF